MKRYKIYEGNAMLEEAEDGEWVKYEDHKKMMIVVSHEPKDLLADIEEGNMIIEKKNKEIELIKESGKRIVKVKHEEINNLVEEIKSLLDCTDIAMSNIENIIKIKDLIYKWKF